MRLDTRALTLAVLVVLALSGCSAHRGASSGTATKDGSVLAAALDLVPEVSDGRVYYADWSLLDHQPATSFAGALTPYDDQLQRDLGISSVDASWELDWQRVDKPGAQLFSYPG
jgi:hypothetical protein